MDSYDVMAPPLRSPLKRTESFSRADEIICRNVALEQSNRKLQEEIDELRNQLSHQDEALDSLRKEVQHLTKREKRPKRVAANYPKHKKGSNLNSKI